MRLNTLAARVVHIFAISLLLLAMFAINSLISAQAPENITIAVSPQQLDVTANPGETLSNVFRLTNASDTSINVRTIPKNFVPRGEEGAVNLTEDDTSFSLASWIDVSPDTVEIPASSTQDFEVDINVPDNAEPGSHFGSVVFQTIPPEQEDAQALISQEIAPVILVRIAGDTTESAQIAEFKSELGFYSNQKSINLISRIENTGNVHFKPTGQIVVKNMFGKEVSSFELDSQNVLPDSVRKYTTEWIPGGLLFGNYTATLTLVSDDGNSISTAETSFFAFPYQVIMPVLLLVGLAIFIIYKGRKRIVMAAKALSGKDIDTKNKEK